MPIRAALFDFGGVILSSPFEAFSRYEAAHGLPPGFIRRVNATSPDVNAWARLERGEIGVDRFCDLFEAEASRQGGSLDGREVLSLLSGEIRPAMVEALRRCHRRLRTGLLTNTFAPPDAAGHLTEVAELFDVIVASNRVGVRKPDRRFYELACEQLDVRPDEAVFLDDLGVNLKPARAMGMETIKVSDPEVAIDELEAVIGFALR